MFEFKHHHQPAQSGWRKCMSHTLSSLKADASLSLSKAHKCLIASAGFICLAARLYMCQTIKTLTMGPAGPLGPAGPSFPWGPWKYKIKTENLNQCCSCWKDSESMVAIKTSPSVLTLTPAGPIGPTAPAGPGEPCNHIRNQSFHRSPLLRTFKPVWFSAGFLHVSTSLFLRSFARKLCSLLLLPILSGLWYLGIRFTGNIIYSRSVLLAIINQELRGLQAIKCMLL